MKNLLMSFAQAVLCAVSVNAQNAKGDWYVGTGDIANIAWTEWSVAACIGFGINDNLAVGLNVSQRDAVADMVIDLDAKYFWKGYFVYGSMPNLDTDNLKLGFGKMFTFHKGVYVDPKIVHDMGQGTTNLMLGVGLKFQY